MLGFLACGLVSGGQRETRGIKLPVGKAKTVLHLFLLCGYMVSSLQVYGPDYRTVERHDFAFSF
jgi:hypothetical protein